MSAYLTYLVRILVDTEHHSRKIELDISVALYLMWRRITETETVQDAVGNNQWPTLRKRWTFLVRMIHPQMRGASSFPTTTYRYPLRD